MPAGDFYPRPPRGGRPSCRPGSDPAKRISIHALREEGDRAGIPPSMRVSEFLSTPSARRATRRWLGRGSGTDYFYPRPPRGGRLIMSNHQDSGDLFLSTPSARRATGKQDLLKYSYGISIHALREEGDCPSWAAGRAPKNFYPRPPRGGRRASSNLLYAGTYFYPRPPRGGRQTCFLKKLAHSQFLSTPSARRATPF